MAHRGILTLPSQYLAVHSATIAGTPRQIFNAWYTAVATAENPSGRSSDLVDLGEGFCTFRNVSDVHPFGARLKIYAEISEDESNDLQVLIKGPARKARAISAVSVSTNRFTSAGHAFKTGDAVEIEAKDSGETVGVLPGGVASLTDYWVNVVDASNFTLHTSESDALAASDAVDVTSTYAGALYAIPDFPDRQARSEPVTDAWIDGEWVEVAVAGVTTTNYFYDISAIEKPISEGHIRIYAVDPDTGAESLVSILAPGETSPNWRRIQTPFGSTDKGAVVDTVCAKRHLDARGASDLISIDNVQALGLAMSAIHARTEGDMTRYSQLLSEAARVLLKEQRRFNPIQSYPPPVILNSMFNIPSFR